MKTSVERLSDYFTPSHYNVYFNFLNLDTTSSYDGRVVVMGEKKHAKHIKLHSLDLTINSVEIDGAQTAFSLDDNILIVESETKGDVELTIDFSGKITDPMHGLYPSYFTINGEVKKIYATQFESHHAREAFPCIDEPAAKATFDLSYATPKHVTALSNMPCKTVEKDENGLTHHFQRTPRMSTYLVALVFGDLQVVSDKTKNDVTVSVYSTPLHKQKDLEFALDSAVRSLEFFEDYFDTPYPLPKCDHVALPNFSSGAMENWGLVTYRESCLIASADSAASTKQLVATVVAHETSHQWFGNLVTMKWWDDLWLNESFANLMEYIAVDAIYPEWNIWNQYVSHEVVSSLRRDQLTGVQAVHTDISHPDEISTLFDPDIVYAKGSRLIKMLWQYVGEEAWRAGLKKYFIDYAYSNTSGDNLWDSIATASGKNVGSFISTWLYQPGYPLITLRTDEDSYHLSQEKFEFTTPPSASTIWPVPLAARGSGSQLFELKEDVIAAERLELPLNSGDMGHYIVRYDDHAMNEIYRRLTGGSLQTVDRISLLNEQSLLAKNLRIPTSSLLPLLARYENETEETVWGMLAGIIGDLKRFTEMDEEADERLKSITAELARPLYENLGIEEKAEDTEGQIKLRSIIMSLLSYSETPSFISEVLAQFRSSRSFESLAAETRPVVFGVVVRHGTAEEFDSLVIAHSSTSDPELRDDLTAALCQAKEPEQINLLLSRLTDKKLVRPQDAIRWFVGMLRNKYAKEAAWEWLVSHWGWILSTYKGDKSYDSFARYSATVLGGSKWLTRYQEFFGSKQSDRALARTISVGLTELGARTTWIEEQKTDVIRSLMAETK